MTRRTFEKSINKLDLRKRNVENEIPGILGMLIQGVQVVNVPYRPGFVYVRLRNNLSEVIQAYNDQTSPVYNLPVVIIRDGVDRSRYKIKGRDLGVYSNWGTNYGYVPDHGHTIGFWTGFLAFEDGVFLGTGVALDFGANIFAQASGTSIFVSIPTGTFSAPWHTHHLWQLSDVNAPSPSDGDVVTWIDASGTWIAKAIPTFDLPIYDDDIYKTDATNIHFNANLDVIISGTSVWVDGQAGGGGGGGGVAIFDDSVFKITGSAISFDDGLDVSITGSMAFVNSSIETTSAYIPILLYDHTVPTGTTPVDNAFYYSGTAATACDYLDIFIKGSSAATGTSSKLVDLCYAYGDLNTQYESVNWGSDAESRYNPGYTIGKISPKPYTSYLHIIVQSPGDNNPKLAYGNWGHYYNLTTGNDVGNSFVMWHLTGTISQIYIPVQGFWEEGSTCKIIGYSEDVLGTLKGADGTPGATGPAGADGANGLDGDNVMPLYEGAIFKVTGTAISFATNFHVDVTGSFAYLSVDGVTGTAGAQGPQGEVGPAGSAGTNTVYYDDSVFKVTGTAVSFDGGLDVVVTGSVAFVSAGTPLTSWNPRIVQGVDVSGTFSAQYLLFSGLCYLIGQIYIQSAGTGGQPISISNVPKSTPFRTVIGNCAVNNAGTSIYNGSLFSNTTGSFVAYSHLEIAAIGQDPSFALATGDEIWFTALYPYIP